MNNIKTLAVADKYKISDLKISNDTSQESVEKYAEWMKAIFIDAKMPKMSESDVFTILLNSVKEKNFKNIELGVKSFKQICCFKQRGYKTAVNADDSREFVQKSHRNCKRV